MSRNFNFITRFLLLLLLMTMPNIVLGDVCSDVLSDSQAAYRSGRTAEAKEGFRWLVSNCSGNAKASAQKFLDEMNIKLTVSSSSAVFNSSAGSWSCDVSCSTDWVVSSKPSWVTISQKSSSSVSFNYSANLDLAERKGNIVIKSTAGSVSRTINVKQAALDASKSGYMNILGVDFCNVDYDGNTIDACGTNNFYTKTLKYIKPRIKYEGLLKSSKNIMIEVKIYNPSGSLQVSSGSNSYTFSNEVTINPGTNTLYSISGWGNNSGNFYSAGTNRYEIWYSGNKIYSGTFYVIQSEATYISASKTSVSPGKSGDTYYIDVYSDGDWDITLDTGSWYSVTKQSKSSIKVYVYSNSGSKRSDYFRLKAGSKSVDIHIHQSGVKQCSNCSGRGQIYTVVGSYFIGYVLTPQYGWRTCSVCGGSGQVNDY